MWGILHPELFLKNKDLLIEMAKTGDFDTYTSERAVQACLDLYAFERIALQPLFYGSGWNTSQYTEFLFKQNLAVLAEVIESPMFPHLWRKEWEEINNSRQAFDTRVNAITEFPEIDLACVWCKIRPHLYAVHEKTTCSVVLILPDDNRYSLHYRYESFVDLVSHRPNPRVGVEPLLPIIQREEKNVGTWWMESVSVAHPTLQFYTSEGAPSRSSIGKEDFGQLVVNYLQNSGTLNGQHWTPMRGFDLGQRVVPSSLSHCGNEKNFVVE